MKKSKTLTLAAFTIWPIAYMFIFMASTAFSFFFASGSNQMPPLFNIIVMLHFVTMLEIIALLVYYIHHLFKTDAIPQDKKALWAVVLFMGNVIAMPVYWYLHIWKPLERVEDRA